MTLQRGHYSALIIFLPFLSACESDPSDQAFELILQDPLQFENPGDRCEADLCTRLRYLIEGAEHTIDFAIYGARDQTELLNALLDAKRRGVSIRGIVDRDFHGQNYYTSTDEWVEQIGSVQDDGARERQPSEEDFDPGCERPPGFSGPLQCLAYDIGDSWLLAEHASREDFTDPQVGGVNHIMHHKFFVVDGSHVWTGSANISDSGTGGYNANAVVVAESEPLAQIYTAEFERLLIRSEPETRKEADGVEVLDIGDAKATVWFSPQDNSMRFGVQALLAKARRTVDVAVFYLTNKYVTAELIAAHRRGVNVRVIVDATSAKNGYSKHEILREAGIPTKVENWGGKMHMKAAVIDGEFLVLGSMNWTRAGEDTNDENTLLVRSPSHAAMFEDFYDDLWSSIPEQWAQSGARPDPESPDSEPACSDGVDNDFDELVDQADAGCEGESRLPPLPPHRVIPKTTSPSRPASHPLFSGTRCDPAYPDWYVCLPVPENGYDLDCRQLPYRSIAVRFPDSHRLDSDGNGRGCETR